LGGFIQAEFIFSTQPATVPLTVTDVPFNERLRMTTTTAAQRLGIDVEQRGRVLLARLQGGTRGEFGPEIAADLDALVTRAETDEGVGAVVITGSHPDRFVAHAELRWLQEGGAASPNVGPRGASAVVHAARAARRVPGVRGLVGRTPLSGAMALIGLHETFTRMNTCGTVFVAALNGSALGLGS
jgi:enoyl-CoA hydratase/carnithine racemase